MSLQAVAVSGQAPDRVPSPSNHFVAPLWHRKSDSTATGGNRKPPRGQSKPPEPPGFTPRYQAGSQARRFEFGTLSGVPADESTWQWALDRAFNEGTPSDYTVVSASYSQWRRIQASSHFARASSAVSGVVRVVKDLPGRIRPTKARCEPFGPKATALFYPEPKAPSPKKRQARVVLNSAGVKVTINPLSVGLVGRVVKKEGSAVNAPLVPGGPQVPTSAELPALVLRPVTVQELKPSGVPFFGVLSTFNTKKGRTQTLVESPLNSHLVEEFGWKRVCVSGFVKAVGHVRNVPLFPAFKLNVLAKEFIPSCPATLPDPAGSEFCLNCHTDSAAGHLKQHNDMNKRGARCKSHQARFSSLTGNCGQGCHIQSLHYWAHWCVKRFKCVCKSVKQAAESSFDFGRSLCRDVEGWYYATPSQGATPATVAREQRARHNVAKPMTAGKTATTSRSPYSEAPKASSSRPKPAAAPKSQPLQNTEPEREDLRAPEQGLIVKERVDAHIPPVTGDPIAPVEEDEESERLYRERLAARRVGKARDAPIHDIMATLELQARALRASPDYDVTARNAERDAQHRRLTAQAIAEAQEAQGRRVNAEGKLEFFWPDRTWRLEKPGLSGGASTTTTVPERESSPEEDDDEDGYVSDSDSESSSSGDETDSDDDDDDDDSDITLRGPIGEPGSPPDDFDVFPERTPSPREVAQEAMTIVKDATERRAAEARSTLSLAQQRVENFKNRVWEQAQFLALPYCKHCKTRHPLGAHAPEARRKCYTCRQFVPVAHVCAITEEQIRARARLVVHDYVERKLLEEQGYSTYRKSSRQSCVKIVERPLARLVGHEKARQMTSSSVSVFRELWIQVLGSLGVDRSEVNSVFGICTDEAWKTERAIAEGAGKFLDENINPKPAVLWAKNNEKEKTKTNFFTPLAVHYPVYQKASRAQLPERTYSLGDLDRLPNEIIDKIVDLSPNLLQVCAGLRLFGRSRLQQDAHVLAFRAHRYNMVTKRVRNAYFRYIAITTGAVFGLGLIAVPPPAFVKVAGSVFGARLLHAPLFATVGMAPGVFAACGLVILVTHRKEVYQLLGKVSRRISALALKAKSFVQQMFIDAGHVVYIFQSSGQDVMRAFVPEVAPAYHVAEYPLGVCTPIQFGGVLDDKVDTAKILDSVSARLTAYSRLPFFTRLKEDRFRLMWLAHQNIPTARPPACDHSGDDPAALRLCKLKTERYIELALLPQVATSLARDARLSAFIGLRCCVVEALEQGRDIESILRYFVKAASRDKSVDATPAVDDANVQADPVGADPSAVPGQCYLRLFREAHRTAILAECGPFPRVKQLLPFQAMLTHEPTQVWFIEGPRYLHVEAGTGPPPAHARLVTDWQSQVDTRIGFGGTTTELAITVALSRARATFTGAQTSITCQLRNLAAISSGRLRLFVNQVLDIPIMRTSMFYSAVRHLCDRVLSAELPLDGDVDTIMPIIESLVDFKRQRTRQRAKPAWALMFTDRQPSSLAQAQVRYPRCKTARLMPLPTIVTPESRADNYAEILHWHAEILAPHVERSVQELLETTEIRRRINSNPYVDTWIAPIAKQHPLFADTPRGIDGLAFATPDNVYESMKRYGPRDETEFLSRADMHAVVDAMFWQAPELYGHAKLLPPSTKKIIKNLKASPGYPLLGMRMRKAELKAAGYLDKIVASSYDSLSKDVSWVGINHVFPKSQVIKYEKVSIPGKLRTIVGVPIVNQIRGRVVNGDINDRRAPWDAPGKPGMPSTGTAFNRMYTSAERMAYHYSLDGTAYDSNVKKQIIDMSVMLRKKGFDWHPDRELIHAALEAVQGTVFNGHLVNLVAELESEFRHMWKEGGIATGHESVTEDNTQTLQICVIVVLSKLWQLSPSQVLSEIMLENVGDDNFLHTNRPLDEVEFKRVAKQITGVDFKFEDQSTKITGIEFLSKTGYEMTDAERLRLREAGVLETDRLKYRVEHNRQSLLMRYANLRLDAHTAKCVTRPSTRYPYFIERAIGYAMLCAHHEDVYDYIVDDVVRLLDSDSRLDPAFKNVLVCSFVSDLPIERARSIMLRFGIREENKAKIMRQYTMPSYDKVLRTFYALIPPDENRKGLVQRSLVLWDTLNVEAYKLDRNLRKVRKVITSLDPEFYDLPDPVAPSDIPLRHSGMWRSTFEIEWFIALRHMERSLSCPVCTGYPDSARAGRACSTDHPHILEIPSIEMMVDLCRQSPFFGCTDAMSFVVSEMPNSPIMKHIEKIEKNQKELRSFVFRETVRAKFRVALISIFYSLLSTGANALPSGLMALGPLMFDLVLQGQRRLYSWLSYSYWLDQGRGSHEIANLSPKDAYGAYKFMACKLVTLVPRSVFLPDVFQGLLPSWGTQLEHIAKAVQHVIGFASRRVGNVSLTPTAEVGLNNNFWETETAKVYDLLDQSPLPGVAGRAVILDAPTGTGKTFFFPQASVLRSEGFRHSSGSMSEVFTHIVVVPTNILAQETKWPENPHYTSRWLRNAKLARAQGTIGELVEGTADHRFLAVTTAGHAEAIIEDLLDLDTRTTVFQIDEYHFQQPAQLYLVHRLLHAGFRLVLSTATPSLSVDRRAYPTFVSSATRKHSITTIPLNTSETWAFDTLMHSAEARRRGYCDRVLIIHPHLKACRRIENAIRDRASMYSTLEGRPFKISTLHAGDRRVPSEGHIVATQMVDAGVTIKGITCVIDAGFSTVSHFNAVQNIRSTATVHTQRKGRTGRTNDGLYIPLQAPSHAGDALTLPTNFQLLTQFETYQEIYNGQLTNMFAQAPLDEHRYAVTPYGRYVGALPAEFTERQHFLRDLTHYAEILLTHANTDKVDEMYRETAMDYRSLQQGAPRESVEHMFTRGVKPSTPVEQLQTAFANDAVEWYTLAGAWVPCIPRCSGGELNNQPFVPFAHPARISTLTLPKNDVRSKFEYLVSARTDSQLLQELPFHPAVDYDEPPPEPREQVTNAQLSAEVREHTRVWGPTKTIENFLKSKTTLTTVTDNDENEDAKKQKSPKTPKTELENLITPTATELLEALHRSNVNDLTPEAYTIYQDVQTRLLADPSPEILEICHRMMAFAGLMPTIE